MKRVILTFAVSVILSASAVAGPGDIAAEHAWARATPKGAVNGAAYITLVNNGTSEDWLLGAVSPVAEKVQFHSMTNDNGVMKMDELPSLDVRPGVRVVLKPGGIHMMMVGVKQQLKEGQTFPLSLIFEKAGNVEVTVRVGKVAAMDEPDAHADTGE